MTDLQAFLQYLITIELFGLLAWPLTRRLFRNFPDQGWSFSKIIGLLLVSYAAWLLGILRIEPFTKATLIVLTAGLGLASTLSSPFLKRWLFKNFKKQAQEAAIPWHFILFEELLFISAFAVWSYLRTFAPDIHGLEKYMDYGFVLSILRSRYFPPIDHFLALEPINYYYFGHLIAAVMVRLSQVPANIAYNLQMNLLFALTAVETFALGAVFYSCVGQRNLKLQMITGGLATFFVTLAGNLHTVFYWPIKGRRYWYPNATRFIPYTIHEFPIYSFVVNDLHGHVSDLPVVLLIMALLLAYLVNRTGATLGSQSLNPRVKKLKPKRSRALQFGFSVLPLLPLALAVGVTYATNAWDFMIYLVLSGFVFLFVRVTQVTKLGQQSSNPIRLRFILRRIIFPVGLQSVVLLMLAVLTMWPYWVTVKPIGKGIGVVPLGGQSPLWQWLILWGHFILTGTIFGLWLIRSGLPSRLKHPQRLDRFFAFFSRLTPSDGFVLLLFLWGFVLILLPEVIFVRDIYPTHYRANTMFKFGYQAFVMFGLATAYVLVRLWSCSGQLARRVFRIIAMLIVFSVALYPVKAVDSGFNGLRLAARKSLDGTAYLLALRPSDAWAINWINANIAGRPVFVEAVGESYTDYARVAANTGIPVVLGWPVHEWLWRGSYTDPMQPTTRLEAKTGQPDTVAQRVADVQKLYETTSVAEAQKIISKYQIDYIYVGNLEREKYPRLSVDKFNQLGEVVYQSSTVTIFKTNVKV